MVASVARQFHSCGGRAPSPFKSLCASVRLASMPDFDSRERMIVRAYATLSSEAPDPGAVLKADDRAPSPKRFAKL